MQRIMAEFLDVFNKLYASVKGDNDTDSERNQTCVTEIDHQLFHLWLLLPSTIMITVLAFTIPRKNKWLSCFHGRPGAIFPMDILGKSKRFSYAAAWGTIAYLAADMVFSQTFAVTLEGKAYVTAMNGILSMVIYGVGYFPLFAGLAIESVTGNTVATLYAWMLLSINIYKDTECDLTYQSRLVLVLRDIPNLLCLSYLSISLPVRTVLAFYNKNARILSSAEKVSILNMSKEVMLTQEATHVKQLLSPQPAPPPSPESVFEKILNTIKGLTSSCLYQRKRNFRYSTRIYSVMFIGIIVIYKTTLEIMVFFLSILVMVERGLKVSLDTIGWEYQPGEELYVAYERENTYFIFSLLRAGKVCFVTSLILACVVGLLTILHMLSSYRYTFLLQFNEVARLITLIHWGHEAICGICFYITITDIVPALHWSYKRNLFDLYKGDNTHIPPRSSRSNASLMVGSMRYAGYQVGYIAWGLIVHFLILLIVTLVCATIIIMIQIGWYQWIIDLFLSTWPVLLVTIFVTVGQLLVAKFVFLQDRGEVLAINNRRILFSFSFFMFFYNIFIGFISCLLRIIKSIIIGAIFLPRLDNSALPRRFQMFDPGFAAYVGFIHVEAAHTHPVLLMFLRLLMLEYRSKDTYVNSRKNSVVVMDEKDKGNQKAKRQTLASVRARTRWFLLYTLHNNPAIRASRKAYMVYIKDVQERFARTYNLNKTAMGKFLKEMNKPVTAVDLSDTSRNAGERIGSQSTAQINWNALLGMHKFMKALQNDPSMSGNDDPGLAGLGLEMVTVGNQNQTLADDEVKNDLNKQVNRYVEKESVDVLTHLHVVQFVTEQQHQQ